jgi:pimeloyl-ACP methyl ester carboxylesterase
MTITGVAAGVPFVAVPPASGAAAAPTVVGWHLMDAPRTESAFAAALPLAGLDAWRVYLGLPLCGSRMPEGGFDELMRLGYEDAVLNMFGPAALGAAAEFPTALAQLRSRFDLAPGPIGLFGGSIGSAVAQLVVAGGEVEVAAAALISPVARLADVVGANERRFGVTYAWSDASREIAARMDFVARAGELEDTPVLIVVGEDDDEAGFRAPAAALSTKLGAELVTIAGMGHALAEEPGLEPAPQIPAAKEVDRLVVDWFATRLPDQTT